MHAYLEAGENKLATVGKLGQLQPHVTVAVKCSRYLVVLKIPQNRLVRGGCESQLSTRMR